MQGHYLRERRGPSLSWTIAAVTLIPSLCVTVALCITMMTAAEVMPSFITAVVISGIASTGGFYRYGGRGPIACALGLLSMMAALVLVGMLLASVAGVVCYMHGCTE